MEDRFIEVNNADAPYKKLYVNVRYIAVLRHSYTNYQRAVLVMNDGSTIEVKESVDTIKEFIWISNSDSIEPSYMTSEKISSFNGKEEKS